MIRYGAQLIRYGVARARVKIGLANLAYNIRRYVWLSSKATPA